jgi:hypothetical protein
VLSIMDVAAVLLTLSAIFGWLNHKFLPTSHSVSFIVSERRRPGIPQPKKVWSKRQSCHTGSPGVTSAS